MKVYTRKGDQGKTCLLGGKRLYKDDLKIESYGNVDELNSNIGFLKDMSITVSDERVDAFLLNIQNILFSIGSWLSLSSNKDGETYLLKRIKDSDVKSLEEEMDQMSESLPPLKNFVLPGGNPLVSYTHIARTVCRRAERSIVALSQVEKVDPILLQYMNRLSDYLFVLSRYFTYKLKVEEILWK